MPLRDYFADGGPADDDDSHPLYEALKGPARTVKIALQMVVGVTIAVLLVLQALPPILPYAYPGWLGLDTAPLKLVAHGLAISAGFELAYMLFTPGPDEAVEPVLLGMAAALLVVVSDQLRDWTSGVLVVLLSVALAILFLVKHAFITAGAKPFLSALMGRLLGKR
jgi:hypothetical protein